MDVGHQGIGGVHHALGLARGAAGVDELGDGIGRGPVALQDLRGIGIALPGGLREQRFKTVRAGTTDGDHVLELWQLRLNAFEHGLVIHTAKVLEHHDQLGLPVTEHEQQLALPKDGHQGIEHRADAHACQVQQRELPDIGQLAGHHIGRPHTQPPQTDGHAVGHAGQLRVVEALRSALCRALRH